MPYDQVALWCISLRIELSTFHCSILEAGNFTNYYHDFIFLIIYSKEQLYDLKIKTVGLYIGCTVQYYILQAHSIFVLCRYVVYLPHLFHLCLVIVYVNIYVLVFVLV